MYRSSFLCLPSTMLPSSEPPLPRLAPLHRLPGPVLAPLLILTTMFSSRSEASKFNTYNLQLPVTSHLLLLRLPCFSPRLFLPNFTSRFHYSSPLLFIQLCPRLTLSTLGVPACEVETNSQSLKRHGLRVKSI